MTGRVYREQVLFNPNNPKHRLYFAKFLKYNNWVDGCPYILEESEGSVATMAMRKMAEWALRSQLRSLNRKPKPAIEIVDENVVEESKDNDKEISSDVGSPSGVHGQVESAGG